MTRRAGIHPQATVGGSPEARDWNHDQHRPHLPPQVDPTALIGAYATIDAGCEQPTTVGARTFCMTKSHVGHDAQVGAECELATGCIIGGHAEIGDRAKIGLGAIVLPYRIIGKDATVGAGAVVTKDVPAGETWCGNPAKPIRRNPIPYTERP